MLKIPYEEYRTQAHSGDIINFKPTLRWYNPVSWFWSAIGHTGMVVKEDRLKTLQCWESTSKGLAGQSGVQLNPLFARLSTYPGTITIRSLYYCHLKYPDVDQKLQSFIRENRGIPYPNLKTKKGRLYLIRAAWDCPHTHSQNIENPAIRFCTDLVVATLKFCTLVIPTANPPEFQPDDTLDGGQIEDYLSEDVGLLNEIQLTF